MQRRRKENDDVWLSCRQLINENSDLKEKLNTNPQHSSLPPSTVAPFKRKKPTPDTASAKQLIGKDYAGFVNMDRFGTTWQSSPSEKLKQNGV